MFDKINIIKIVSDHFATLKHFETGKYSIEDFILFLGLPFLVSGLLTYYKLGLCTQVLVVLITAFSIFAALLFNLLLLIYDIIKKNNKDAAVEKSFKLKKQFIKEIYINISFNILLSITTILLSIVYLIVDNHMLQVALSFIILYITALFILTLFMVLKRVHILLFKEIESDI